LQLAAEESIDLVLKGRIKVIQRREGYRFSEDSLHLCQFIGKRSKARGIDLGTGCGIIAMVLVKERKVGHMVGLEIQENLAALAKRNVLLNELKGKVEVRVGDIRRVREFFPGESFDLAVSNPPYYELRRGRLSPSTEKRMAKHEWACSLEDVVKGAAYLLAPKGVFGFCHREERWGEIRRMIEQVHLKVSRKESILSPRRKPTGLMLVEAVRGKGKY
jgi:tRNA1Val (adenine37-N6)-methyltransferase